jgi:hypothetical protein
MKLDGACHCGAIQFEAATDPNNVVVCHCTDCQTFSSSAFRVSAFTEPNSFRLAKGTPKIYLKTAESGNKRRQAFCPDCGTAIYSSDDADPPSFLALRVGGLRQRDALKPQKQIWCRSQSDWLATLKDVDVVETA